ncbi:tyrosine-type recombinase/integrase [Desulfobacterota bacterium AH_259_B03_O07]|nr:tyrosine-type recombinase/integrase [Desulfobacterota bacterium AH_259_B03_O07]
MSIGKTLFSRTNLDILDWTIEKLPPYLTKDGVWEVLGGMRNKPLYHLLINFLWQTGARISEALSIKVSDIDFYSKVVRMPSLKKRKPQIKTIPLQGDLIGEIGAYVGQEGLGKEDRIFSITRQHAHRIVRNACAKAGIEKTRSHCHVLRHSFAVNSVLQRVPLPILQKWMGHSDIKNTMVYLNILSQDTRDFYEALEF